LTLDEAKETDIIKVCNGLDIYFDEEVKPHFNDLILKYENGVLKLGT
jgi:hypothetical protein